MSDAALRQLERQAAVGDHQARARILLRRIRIGELERDHLRLAAYLGDLESQIACQAMGLEQTEAPHHLYWWTRELLAWDRQDYLVLIRAAIVAVRSVEELWTFHPTLLAGVEVAESYVDDPSMALVTAASTLLDADPHEGRGPLGRLTPPRYNAAKAAFNVCAAVAARYWRRVTHLSAWAVYAAALARKQAGLEVPAVRRSVVRALIPWALNE